MDRLFAFICIIVAAPSKPPVAPAKSPPTVSSLMQPSKSSASAGVDPDYPFLRWCRNPAPPVMPPTLRPSLADPDMRLHFCHDSYEPDSDPSAFYLTPEMNHLRAGDELSFSSFSAATPQPQTQSREAHRRLQPMHCREGRRRHRDQAFAMPRSNTSIRSAPISVTGLRSKPCIRERREKEEKEEEREKERKEREREREKESHAEKKKEREKTEREKTDRRVKETGEKEKFAYARI